MVVNTSITTIKQWTISFIILSIGIIFAGFGLLLVTFNLIESIIDIIIIFVLVIIGFFILKVGIRYFDHREIFEHNILDESEDLQKEFTALQVFSVSNNLSNDINKIVYATFVAAAIILPLSIVFISIWHYDDPDPMFLYTSIVYFILYLFLIYFSLRLRSRYNELIYVIQPLNDHLGILQNDVT
ncbi:MAG: hypothetical protein HeimC2_00350 [Candidatus Heimdallarchaeota archaeon LC_2]|nr:MAG: hypothetical protein HeimC2_00350 [Candidatus Heimdallarchaeota archaeon LC_2]